MDAKFEQLEEIDLYPQVRELMPKMAWLELHLKMPDF